MRILAIVFVLALFATCVDADDASEVAELKAKIAELKAKNADLTRLQTTDELGSVQEEGDDEEAETLLSAGKPVTSSPILHNNPKWVATNAVKSGAVGAQCNWPSAGQVCIAAGTNKFWQTDLQKTSTISRVELRGFNLAGYSSNVQISVCNDSNGADCAKCGGRVTVAGANGSVTAQCSSAKGRYVRLFNANTGGRRNWHFCRVNVYGTNSAAVSQGSSGGVEAAVAKVTDGTAAKVSCKDLYGWCPTAQIRQNCVSARHGPATKKACPKTCGVCGKTAAAKVAEPAKDNGKCADDTRRKGQPVDKEPPVTFPSCWPVGFIKNTKEFSTCTGAADCDWSKKHSDAPGTAWSYVDPNNGCAYCGGGKHPYSHTPGIGFVHHRNAAGKHGPDFKNYVLCGHHGTSKYRLSHGGGPHNRQYVTCSSGGFPGQLQLYEKCGGVPKVWWGWSFKDQKMNERKENSCITMMDQLHSPVITATSEVKGINAYDAVKWNNANKMPPAVIIPEAGNTGMYAIRCSMWKKTTCYTEDAPPASGIVRLGAAAANNKPVKRLKCATTKKYILRGLICLMDPCWEKPSCTAHDDCPQVKDMKRIYGSAHTGNYCNPTTKKCHNACGAPGFSSESNTNIMSTTTLRATSLRPRKKVFDDKNYPGVRELDHFPYKPWCFKGAEQFGEYPEYFKRMESEVGLCSQVSFVN